jgi:hypothetical protein
VLCPLDRQTDTHTRYIADSQCLAATNDMLCCFSLLPAHSASRIPFKQTHSV